MITYEKGDIKFNFRVAGLIYNKDKSKFLVLQSPGCEFCVLPGGRVEELESSTQSIARELKEELNINATVKITKLFESFFLLNDKKYHELTYYFLVTDIDDKSLFVKNEFAGNEAKDWFKWIEIEKLDGVDFRPITMKKYIIDKDFSLEHIVVDELKK